MNLSGQAVSSVARYFRIEPSEILVVHDDLDLAPGQAKLKFGGGHGGHNGLRDIHAHLATPDYWRLRLGIGHPGVKAEVVDYVLRIPGKEDIESIQQSDRNNPGCARPDARSRHGARHDEDSRQAGPTQTTPTRS